MKKVLITGGIGSGKTTVCKMFDDIGVPVFYSDDASRRVVEDNKDVVNKIKDNFGDHLYIDGKLDRKALADIVFNDKDKLELINSIVHPVIHDMFDSWVEVNKVFKESEYVIEEVAIGIELGIQERFDYVIVITADEEDRISRVMKRDSCSRDKVIERMNNQISDHDRSKHAHYVINNSEFPNAKCQVKKIHEDILGEIKNKS